MRRYRGLAACFAMLSLGTGVVACGGASKSSTSQAGTTSASSGVNASYLEQARADVAKARQPLTKFLGPTESPGPVPPKKQLVAITCSPSPFCIQAAQATKAAAQMLGWDTRIVQGDGSPPSWVNAVDSAISSGADAIVLNSADPITMPQAIAKAKRAGIPVVATGVCEKPPAGVINTVDIPGKPDYGASLGSLLAEWIAQRSPDGAKLLELTSPAFFCLTIPQKAFEQGIAKAGPAFQIVAHQDTPLTDIGSQQGVQRQVSMLRAHPDASYFYIQTSSWAPTFQQALQVSQKTGKVTGVGINGNNFISQIRDGFPQVLVGADSRNYGFAAVDSLIRYFNHKPQQIYKNLGLQLIDKDNAADTQGDEVTAKYDLPAAWGKLWGVSK